MYKKSIDKLCAVGHDRSQPLLPRCRFLNPHRAVASVSAKSVLRPYTAHDNGAAYMSFSRLSFYS